MYDWGKPLNIVMKKVYAYDKIHKDVDIQCTANAIVDLCQSQMMLIVVLKSFFRCC